MTLANAYGAACRRVELSHSAKGSLKRVGLGSKSSVVLVASAACQPAVYAQSDSDAMPSSLEAGFLNPPNAVRPRVWWHWMNGNITKDGIRKDLEWMKRVGVQGMQNFDANLMTPQIVEERLAYSLHDVGVEGRLSLCNRPCRRHGL